MQAWKRSIRLVNTSRWMSNAASDAPKALGYQRPLAPGVLPVYDLAVELLQKDSAAKKALLEAEVDPKNKASLEIQSQVNLPEVRWAFAQGKYDLSQPVYRHLLEQAWRRKGALDLLMERVHQMKVIPDLLPAFHPTVDLQLSFVEGEEVVPGVFLPVNATLQPPSITAQAFHPEGGLYTLLMVDPDVPDPSTQGFLTYVHVLQPNIPLSATKSQVLVSDSEDTLPYIPPHPQNGTPYHRYTTFLLPQPSKLAIEVSKIPRENFNMRAFFREHQYDRGGGIHMFRGEWDKSVSAIYKNILEQPEPKFGRPPQPNTYVDATGRRRPKYIVAYLLWL
ncbi:hypothetical protein FS749_015125 [Ceratobasidium sp. UAMH 11750]|nr:hypothetical protein FS749_015125 [Ceratobasidium sp. UAMH 11750]